MDAQGSPQCSRGVVFGGSWSSPGTLLNAPGLLWGTIWGAWEEHLELFGMVFVSQSGVRHENSEKLESDDPLNENAMFLCPKGSKIRPKWYQNWPTGGKRVEKKRKESKECPGSPPDQPGDDFLRFRAPRGGGGAGGGGRRIDDKGG